MSKIGERVIEIPAGVEVTVNGKDVHVKGQHGTLSFVAPRTIEIEKKEQSLIVTRKNEDKKSRSLHGLYRQLISNAVEGVLKPWEKKLEIVGTGFNVKQQGEELNLKVGYSHPTIVKKVPTITLKAEGNTTIVVSGADKQLVGQVAHLIKMIKKPDAYKGKGIRYQGEQLKLKPGKKAKTASA